MAANMRAKMMLETITRVQYPHATSETETLKFRAVAKNGQYPSDGTDEDNTYAMFSPAPSCEITITNPALLGQLKPGEFYYVNFTPVA
jgi:hypothetical protein